MSWLSRWSWVLVAALLVLLAVLAVLQHRWTEGVSRALEQRMRSDLAAAAERFAEDFDRELTRAFLHFQGEGPGNADDLGEVTARRLEDWRQTAPVPALVGEVYRVERQEDRLGLGRLMPEARFEPVEWPAELDALRLQLLSAPDPGRWREERPAPFLLAPEVPALILPLIDPPAFRGPRPGPHFRPAASGWILLRLDLGVIRDHFLPLLTGQYFAGGEDFDFEVEVVAAESRERIYRSDPQRAESSAGSDLEIGMFAFLRDDELRRLFFDTRLAGSLTGPGRRMAGPRMAGPRGLGRFGFRPGSGPPGGPPPEGRTPGEGLAADERGGWRLLVRHRQGSLEAAVDRFRRRNLGLGFGVLALLAATVGVLLISSRRAQRLAAQQVELVAGITHELRTPIAAVHSLGQNLADGVVAEPDQVRRYGAVIQRQGQRLSRLVEQALELAGILSARKALALERCTVAAVVEAAAADCASLVEERGARLEVEVADGLPAVDADADALARAVANLISNAVKYGGDDPGVEVRAGSDPARREVSIEVADRGPGIPRDELPHVFEPFYRGRNATVDQAHGSGLGLSLVRRIAEAHGGRAEVRSRSGGGCVFTLRLPASKENHGEREDPAG